MEVGGEKDSGNFMFGSGTFGGGPSVGTLLKIGYRLELGASNSLGSDIIPGSASIWRSYSRAVLAVPFGRLYNDNSEPGKNFKKLRELIDGIEKWDKRYDQFPVNDELLPFGLGYLATAIYGGRAEAPARHPSSDTNEIYHKGSRRGIYKTETCPYDDDLFFIQYGTIDAPDPIMYGNPWSHPPSTGYDSAAGIRLEKGMAVGSIIDFFSPPTTTSTLINKDGLVFPRITPSFSPLRALAKITMSCCSSRGSTPLRNTKTPRRSSCSSKTRWKCADARGSVTVGKKQLMAWTRA